MGGIEFYFRCELNSPCLAVVCMMGGTEFYFRCELNSPCLLCAWWVGLSFILGVNWMYHVWLLCVLYDDGTGGLFWVRIEFSLSLTALWLTYHFGLFWQEQQVARHWYSCHDDVLCRYWLVHTLVTYIFFCCVLQNEVCARMWNCIILKIICFCCCCFVLFWGGGGGGLRLSEYCIWGRDCHISHQTWASCPERVQVSVWLLCAWWVGLSFILGGTELSLCLTVVCMMVGLKFILGVNWTLPVFGRCVHDGWNWVLF